MAQVATSTAPNRYAPMEVKIASRLTVGPTHEDVGLAHKIGPHEYLLHQLNYQQIDDSEVEGQVAKMFTHLKMIPFTLDKVDQQGLNEDQLVNSTIWRSVYSKRQLCERMVEFWTDHFNIHIQKVSGWLKIPDDRDVIRRHAMDTFPNLLWASAHSPAMMMFLDNDSSAAPTPNQNYARELMELHTLGVGNGYTQQDVIEVARCFSGWSFNWDDKSIKMGTFEFHEWDHDEGTKTVLGHHFPAGGGIHDGEAVIRILAAHPNTARHISAKMINWLLMYNPPSSLVDKVATVYMETGGNIRSMIYAIFTSSEFASAPPKYKRPYHYCTSIIRALRPAFTKFDDLRYNYLSLAGHAPFDWAPPNGYPDALGYWAGLILPRWNFPLALMNDQVDGLQVNMIALIGGVRGYGGVAQRIDDLLFFGEMPPQDKADLLTFLRSQPLTTHRVRAAFALALCSPGFQNY